MKKINSLLLLVIILCGWQQTKAQNVNMSNGTIYVGGGNFYDAGGSGAVYNSNETFQLTFFPAVFGKKVSIAFSSFTTETGYDGLLIYNGNSAGAPLISSGLAAGSNATTCPAGSWRGTGSPGTVTSTATDGSLTFLWHSDGSVTYDGWAAAISLTGTGFFTFSAPTGASATSNNGVGIGTGTTQITVPGPTSNCYGYGFTYTSGINGFGIYTSFTGGTSSFTLNSQGDKWPAPVLGTGTNGNTSGKATFTMSHTITPGCLATAFPAPVLTLNIVSPAGAYWINDGNNVYVPLSFGQVVFNITVTSGGTNVNSASHTLVGCAGYQTFTSLTMGWTTLTQPTVSYTGSNSVCTGATTTLSPTSGGTWSSSNSTIASVTNAGAVTGSSAGVVEFTFQNSAAPNCPANTTPLAVNPKPATPTMSPTSGSICNGGSVTLNTSVPTLAVNAMNFNGSSNSLSLGNPSALQITGDQTIEMWLYPTNFTNRVQPYNKAYAGEGTITLETDGTLSYYYGNNGGNGPGGTYAGYGSATAIALNTWSHVAVVRDMTNSQVRWYINGVLTSTNATQHTPVAGSNTITIGTGYTGFFYPGRIDELRVWSTAKSTAQVQASYNKLIAPFTTSNLQLYYRMDQSSGAVVYDLSGNNIDGTLVGSPTWVTSTAPIVPDFTWSPSTGLNTTSGASVVASPTSNQTYTVTASSPVSCSSTNTVAVTVTTPPSASAGTAVSTCSNSGAVNITSGATASNNTGVNWTSSGTGTWSNQTSLTLASYTPSSADISAGSVTLTLTAIANSPCSNATSNKTLTITAAPTANAGTAVSTCSNTASVNVTTGATATNNSGVNWSSSGTGTWSSQTSLTLATYTPSAADKSAGSVTITLSATGNSPCGNATSNKTLTITPEPTVNAGTAITTCSNAGAVNITAGASAGSTAGVNWTSSGTGTWTSQTSLTSAAYTPSGADISAGGVTLTLTATGNSPCGNATSNKTLTITAAPDVSNFSTSATSPVCAAGTSVVTVTSSSLGNATFTVTYNLSAPNAATGSTASLTMSGGSGTFNLPALTNTGTTTVTITAIKNASNCTSNPSGGNTASVVVNAGPTISITNAADVCTGGTVTLGTSVSGGAGSNTNYLWERSANAGSTWSTVQNSATASYTTSGSLTAGNYLYRVTLTQSGNNCSAVSANVAANVAEQPFVNDGSQTIDICKGGTAVFTLSQTGGGAPSLIYEWQYISNGSPVTDGTPNGLTYTGGGTSSLAITAASNSTFEGTVSYQAKIYATGNGCTAAFSLTNSLTVHAKPTVTNPTPASQTGICQGGSVSPISVTVSGGTGTVSYQWYSNNSNNTTTGTLIPGATSNTYTPPSTAGTIYYYAIIDESGNGCGPVTTAATASVNVNPAVSATVVVDDCMNASLLDKYYVLVTGTSGTPPYTYTSAFYTSTTNQGIYEVNAGTSNNTFVVQDAAGCSVTTAPVTAPVGHPTDIVFTSTTGNVSVDCWDNNFNKWITFRDAVSNNAILAINDNGSNLGLVTVNAYKDATPPVIYNNGLATNCTWTPFTAMRRHFKVTTTHAPSTGVDVMLFFTDQEYLDLKTDAYNNNIPYPNAGYACSQLDDVYSFDQLYVTKYSGPNEDGNYLNNAPTPIGLYRVYGDNSIPYNPLVKGQYTGQANTGFQSIYGGSTTHHYVKMTVTEFSEFWIHGSQTGEALPVEMIYLQADAIDNAFIQITWATAVEINNKGFEIQRSTDGQSWQGIGWVDGHNNSTVQNNYSFDDRNVTSGIVYYYRLKQIDNDNAFQYTDLVSARLNGEITFTVMDFVPNPSMTNTNLVITASKDQEISITFYNIVGQKAMESTQQIGRGANTLQFDVSSLAAGTYTAVVSAGNEVYTRKLVIAR